MKIQFGLIKGDKNRHERSVLFWDNYQEIKDVKSNEKFINDNKRNRES